MKEEYLHFAFEKRMFGSQFITTNKKQLKILDFGELNVNAGPDFLDAKIEFDGQVWAGAIEFHVKASDWYRHNHQFDPAYGTVIAHFVYTFDSEVEVGEYTLPAVELKTLVDQAHYRDYLKLIRNRSVFLCESYLPQIAPSIIEIQKQTSLKERLRFKSIVFLEDIERDHGDSFNAYYTGMARCFGGKVNQIPFEELVLKMNKKWLAKLNYDPKRIEALLLGLGGFLKKINPDDEYENSLKREFEFQKHLLGISDFVINGWKYSRMRPANFPDKRIAQFAHFISKSLIRVHEQNKVFDLDLGFQIELDSYWQNHFRIGVVSNQSSTIKISKNMLNLLAINVILPFQFAMAWRDNDEEEQWKILNHFRSLEAEKNNVTKEWLSKGLKIKSAFDSQSLLALKKQYCIQKKCLFCKIGKTILNK